MSRATKAILHHASDLSQEERHQYCPLGQDSWCGQKKDEANNKSTWQPRLSLPKPIFAVLKPTFDFLSSPALLEGCRNCLTQNQNESLHHLVWSIVPKDQYHSAPKVQLGINLGVLQFNQGMTRTAELLYDSLGMQVSESSQVCLQTLDAGRIRRAED